MKRRRDNAQNDPDSAEDGITAYNALMTLLKDQKQKQPSRAHRGASFEAHKQHQPSKKAHNEDDPDAIEGVDVNDDDIMVSNDEESDEEMVIDLDNDENPQDPFEWHFANPENVPESLQSVKSSQTKAVFPGIKGNRSLVRKYDCSKQQSNLVFSKLEDLPLKYRLIAPFRQATKQKTLSGLQSGLAQYLLQYSDILFPALSLENEAEIQDLVLLHVLNHIYKTRDRVLKNNAKIAAHSKKENAENHDGDAEDNTEYRDQGFTRPKVLILAATKNFGYEIVTRMADITGLNQVENRKRLQDAFYDSAELPESKPADMRRNFKGNTGDMFCLGVKFTRQALKLYSSFYTSDIIVASPLGLRLVIEKGDYDFLSSIEVCVLSHAHLLQMQSWENVEKIMRHMNLIPKESHDCDFSRVRPWYLDDKSSWFRQTIVLSEYATPEMNALYSSSKNVLSGGIKVKSVYDDDSCAIANIGARVTQTFARINSSSPGMDPDARFKSFVSQVLPSLMRSSSSDGTLIFIPSYLDFVRVRNYMDDKNYSFVSISEYSSQSDTSRARASFANGKASIMLYTERLHHFRRYSIKGVKEIIFYAPPDCPTYYSEMMRLLIRTNIETGIDLSLLRARVLYSQWDSLKLERIIGTERLGPLIKGVNDIYEYV